MIQLKFLYNLYIHMYDYIYMYTDSEREYQEFIVFKKNL